MKFFLIGCMTTLALIAAGVYVLLDFGFLSFRAGQSPSGFEQKYATQAVGVSAGARIPIMPVEKSPPRDVVNRSLLYREEVPKLVKGVRRARAERAAPARDEHPGDPQSVLGRSFYPPVPLFMEEAPDNPANQNFYITKHGIRLTGMPAWGNLLSDDQIWKLTAFLSQLEKLLPSVDQERKKGESAALFRKGAASNTDHLFPRSHTVVSPSPTSMSNFDQTCEQYWADTRITPGYKQWASSCQPGSGGRRTATEEIGYVSHPACCAPRRFSL